MHFDRAEVVGFDGEVATVAALLGYMEAEGYVERVLGGEMGSRELIKPCVCCWDYLMLYVSMGLWRCRYSCPTIFNTRFGELCGPLSPTQPPSTPFWLISTHGKVGLS